MGASRAWARGHSHRDNRRRAEISIQVRFKTAQHALQESSVLCCAALCCAVLCCAVLCCAVLCCAVLCCAVVDW